VGQLARQRIWASRGTTGAERLTLLALADATPDGAYVCWPSVATLADMAGVSPRTVQRIVQALRESGQLAVVEGRGRTHTTRYVVLVGLTDDEAREALADLNGDTAVSPIPDRKGDTKPDTAMSPITTGKGDIFEEKVTSEAGKGDIAVSPEQKEQKYITHAAPAAADAAPSPPARTKKPRKAKADAPTPEEPVTPAVIRQALADVCLIGKTSSAEVRKDAGSRAKAIWRAYRDTRTDEEIAADIRYVGAWCLKGAWQCKDGSAPRPKLIGDYWDQAMAARKPAQPAANGRHYEPVPLDQEVNPYEARRKAREAARHQP